jgi:D-glycero-D-manno-heptose 1,7-bisphosphate phosphatase
VFFDDCGGIVFLSKNQENSNADFFRNLCLTGVTIIETNYLINHTFSDSNFEKSIIPEAISKNLLFPLESLNYFKDSGTSKSLESIQNDYQCGVFEGGTIKCYLVDLDDTLVSDSIKDKKNSFANFHEDALGFIKSCNENNIKLIVVTNQPALAKGQLTQLELDNYISSCERFLSQRNLFWDAFLYCPHHPEYGHIGEVKALKIECSCRKPKIGLIHRIIELHGKNLFFLGMIGDSEKDLGFAKNLGVPFIHVNRIKECEFQLDTHACITSLENLGAKN